MDIGTRLKKAGEQKYGCRDTGGTQLGKLDGPGVTELVAQS